MKQRKGQSGYYKFSNEAFAAFLMCCGFYMDKIQQVDEFDCLFYFRKGVFSENTADEAKTIAELIELFLGGDMEINLLEYIDCYKHIQFLKTKSKLKDE